MHPKYFHDKRYTPAGTPFLVVDLIFIQVILNVGGSPFLVVELFLITVMCYGQDILLTVLLFL